MIVAGDRRGRGDRARLFGRRLRGERFTAVCIFVEPKRNLFGPIPGQSQLDEQLAHLGWLLAAPRGNAKYLIIAQPNNHRAGWLRAYL